MLWTLNIFYVKRNIMKERYFFTISTKLENVLQGKSDKSCEKPHTLNTTTHCGENTSNNKRQPPEKSPKVQVVTNLCYQLGTRQLGASPATWEWQGLCWLSWGQMSLFPFVHLQKNVTQKQSALGIPFPDVPTTRSPLPAKPQGTGRALLYLNGCYLLVLLLNRYRMEVKRTEEAVSTQKCGGGDKLD